MKNKKILDLFEQNELDVSRLYRLYSQKIRGKKKFWEQLSREEIGHALEIRKSYQGKEDIFKESQFARGTIQHVADFVENCIQETKTKKISHKKALETALRVEQSFIEKKCFELFIPNHEKVEAVLKKLNKESQEHLERLQKEFEKITKK